MFGLFPGTPGWRSGWAGEVPGEAEQDWGGSPAEVAAAWDSQENTWRKVYTRSAPVRNTWDFLPHGKHCTASKSAAVSLSLLLGL